MATKTEILHSVINDKFDVPTSKIDILLDMMLENDATDVKKYLNDAKNNFVIIGDNHDVYLNDDGTYFVYGDINGALEDFDVMRDEYALCITTEYNYLMGRFDNYTLQNEEN
ncbi:MAG: hypothetical protein MJ237_06050 [bacterium]|nr:hypothetical protein [bacterium]